MQLNQEQIASILEDAKPSIIKGLQEQVTNQVKWESNTLISKMIQEEVTAFMNAVVIPELKAHLIESKEGLISLALSTSSAICEALTSALAQAAKEKLESPYSRRSIFEALFK